MRTVVSLTSLLCLCLVGNLRAEDGTGKPPALFPKTRVTYVAKGSQDRISSASREGKERLAHVSQADQTAIREFANAMSLYRQSDSRTALGGSATIQQLYGMKGEVSISGDELTTVFLDLTKGVSVRFVLEIDDNKEIQDFHSMEYSIPDHRFQFTVESLAKDGSVVKSLPQVYFLRPGAGDRKLYFLYSLSRAIETLTPKAAWARAEATVRSNEIGTPDDSRTRPFEEVLKEIEE